MDSEDEFMSGISDSQEEDLQQDSDDGSLGDGMPSVSCVVAVRANDRDFRVRRRGRARPRLLTR